MKESQKPLGVPLSYNLPQNTWISLVYLGVLCLAISFWLWNEGLSRQPAAEVGVYLYIEPLITVVAASILIDERITVWLIVGAILVTAGVYIAERYGKAVAVEHDA